MAATMQGLSEMYCVLGMRPSSNSLMEAVVTEAKKRWSEVRNQDGWSKEDALVYGLEKLEDWGLDFDPTEEEYDDMLNQIS